MYFRVFSEGKCTGWGYFLGLLKFQIFVWVCLIFQIFWSKLEMLGPSLRMKKNIEYPPPPWNYLWYKKKKTLKLEIVLIVIFYYLNETYSLNIVS